MGLKFKLKFSPPQSADVASRKLKVKLVDRAGVETESFVDFADPMAVDYILVTARDVHVAVSLADIDGSGNMSEYSAAVEFDALDTFPPITPGIQEVTPLGEE